MEDRTILGKNLAKILVNHLFDTGQVTKEIAMDYLMGNGKGESLDKYTKFLLDEALEGGITGMGYLIRCATEMKKGIGILEDMGYEIGHR